MENLTNHILGPDGRPFVQSASGISSVRNGFAAGLGGLFGCGDDGEIQHELKSPLEGLSLAANWRCLQYLGHACGKTPLEVKKRTPRGGEETYHNHPASSLLDGEANRLPQSSYAWKYQMAMHAAYLGNALAYICRDANGRPTSLVKFDDGYFAISKVDGRLQYDLRIGREWHMNVDPYDIIHLWFWSWDGMIGIPFWLFHARQLGMGVAADRFAAKYFGGGAQPLATLTLPRGLNPDPASKEFKDYVESYKRAMNRLGRDYRLLLIRQDQDYKAISHNAKDAQLDESRSSFGRDICMLYGFPPFILGHDLDSNAYKDLNTKNDMVVDGLDPFFCQFETECDVKLRTENQKRTRACRFVYDRDKLRSMDRKSFVELISAKIRAGLLTPAEGRALCNEPALGNEGEDCLLMDAGVVTLESLCVQSSAQTSLVEAIQKIYLGVGEVITTEEARQILNEHHGADLDDDYDGSGDDETVADPGNNEEIEDATELGLPKSIIDDANRRALAAITNAYSRRARASADAILALLRPDAALYARIDRIYQPLGQLEYGRQFAERELLKLIRQPDQDPTTP